MKKTYLSPRSRMIKLHLESVLLVASEDVDKGDGGDTDAGGGLSNEKIWGNDLWDDKEK